LCKISIIIPVHNKCELTKECIDSIFSNKIEVSFEVIVVDDASKDDTEKYLESESRIKYCCNDENMGFSKSCNIGARLAKGKYLLFLNNDTLHDAGWLDELYMGMKRTKSDMVGGKVLYPNRKVQYAGLVITPRGCDYRLQRRDEYDPLVLEEKEVYGVSAVCCLIKKSIFDKLSGFDERFRTGWEDVDFCHRLRESGGKLFYIPNSVIVHYESQSPGRYNFERDNRKLYLSLWAGQVPEYVFTDANKVPIIVDEFQCPRCDYVTNFLPQNLNMTCPNCKSVPAYIFVQIRVGETPN
jgi:GT2 family glycosyltransferase